MLFRTPGLSRIRYTIETINGNPQARGFLSGLSRLLS
jgi:hypothetical protein